MKKKIDCIFYIGGASGSGKSHTAKTISDKYGVSIIKLDDYYNIFHPVCNDTFSEQFIREVSKRLVEDIIKFQGSGIIEGGWISPSVASEIRETFNKKFVPIYVGYADDNAQNRLNFLKSNPGHWLSNKSNDNFSINFLNKQIKDSEGYKKECQQVKIDYIDFTNPKVGCVEILTYFEENIFKKID